MHPLAIGCRIKHKRGGGGIAFYGVERAIVYPKNMVEELIETEWNVVDLLNPEYGHPTEFVDMGNVEV